MGYSLDTHWGRMVELGGLCGSGCSLNTVPANYVVAQIATPTASTLDNPRVIGAYLDLIVARYVNTFAGANWTLANAGNPTLELLPTGHTQFITKTDVTGMGNCTGAGTFSGYRIYGDNNFASVFRFGHDHDVILKNARSSSNNLVFSDVHPIMRLYLV